MDFQLNMSRLEGGFEALPPLLRHTEFTRTTKLPGESSGWFDLLCYMLLIK